MRPVRRANKAGPVLRPVGRGDCAGAGRRKSGGTVLIEMLNMDCMEYMAGLPDKAFDLSCVDPPYGIGVKASVGGNNKAAVKQYNGFDDSNIPDRVYFEELIRVSKNQIIWGGNYFIENLKNTSCFIVWDKENTGNFADCELAWTSFNSAVRKFSFRWNGMIQGNMKNKEERIHNCQKPVALYKWLLSRYAKPGDRILDTHGGSGSICIACHDLGYDLTWIEKDADYYEAACKRYKNHAAQASLFDQAELTKEAKEVELF